MIDTPRTMKNKNRRILSSYLVLIENNKILLLRRFNTGYEDGNYSMVAGKVDTGENFTQCIIREAREEAGILLAPKNLSVAHIMHRNSVLKESVDTFFITEKWKGNIVNKEPNKCDDLSWFNLNDLPKNIIRYIEQAINNIKSKIFYSEHGW